MSQVYINVAYSLAMFQHIPNMALHMQLTYSWPYLAFVEALPLHWHEHFIYTQCQTEDWHICQLAGKRL